MLLSTGCSIVVDADRSQCSSARDCVRPGVGSDYAVCEEGLCRVAPRRQDCTPGEDCASDLGSMASDACVGARCAGDAGRRDATVPARAGDSGKLPRDGGREQPRDMQGSAGERDAALPAAREASVARECETTEDCVELGRVGTQCVNGGCWKVTDVHPCSGDAECNALAGEFTDSKCVQSSCVPNPRWRCEPPPPVSPDSEPLMLTILVRDALSLSPLPNIQALVCQKLDLDCTAPVQSVSTDRSGNFTFAVPRDFAGYLRFEDRRYAPALYSFPAVLPSDGKLDPAPLIGATLIGALASSIGGSLDAQRGQLMLITEDCFSEPLSGVSFASAQADEATIQFYVQDLLPSAMAKETGEVGNGGYLNFPPGIAVLDVRLARPEVELTTVSLLVRPGFITVAYLGPESR